MDQLVKYDQEPIKEFDLDPEKIMDEGVHEPFPTRVLGTNLSYQRFHELIALKKLTGTRLDTVYRELCMKDLYYLCRYVFNRPDMMNQFVFDRAQDIMARNNMTLDLWARFHYKSTLNTFGEVVRDMLNSPLKTQAIFSYNNSTAEAFTKTIRNNMEACLFLQRIFPKIIPPGGHPYYTNSAITTLEHAGRRREASVMSFGVIDTMPTSFHFGKRIYDDLVTPEAVKTVAAMTNVEDSYRMSKALKDPQYDEEIVIGTRYHFGDLYGKIIKANASSPRPFQIRLHPAEVGGVPVMFTAEELKFWRFEMGSYIYACQMMQNPNNPEDCEFDQQYLQTYDQLPSDLRIRKTCLFCDPVPPSDKARKGCYAVIMYIIIDDNNHIWIDNYWSKIAPRKGEIEDQFTTMCRAHRPDVPAIEDEAMQILMLNTLNEKLRAIGFFREVKGLKTKKRSKDTRVLGLQPLWEQRRIHIRSSLHLLIDEFAHFPYWSFRDHVDVLAYVKDFMPNIFHIDKPKNTFDRSSIVPHNRSREQLDSDKERGFYNQERIGFGNQDITKGNSYSWQTSQKKQQGLQITRGNSLNPRLIRN